MYYELKLFWLILFAITSSKITLLIIFLFYFFFSSWLNHIMHTNIVVFIVLEMFISFRSYPSRFKGLAGLSAFMLAYLVWLHVIKHYSGVWVYPVLEVLQLPQRIVFFIGSLVFTLGLYMFGEVLNNLVWSKELKMAQRKHK